MGKEFIPGIQLPPGFRFHPSDEELIVHYLRNKATSNPLPASIIREVDLYKCNPWDLQRNALLGDEEWYFFTPRDRKYPKGVRPNRMAGSGYWKATGSDKPILSSCGEKTLGVKKGLVFYKGRPPKGVKTNWIMHEYRIPEATVLPTRQKGCMRLDDWVLCRVRQKSTVQKNMWEDRCVTDNNPSRESKKGDEPCYTNTYDNLAMVKKFLHRECLVPPILFAPQGLPLLDRVSNLRFEASKTSTLNLKDNYETNYTQYDVQPSDSFVIGKKRKHREGNWEESFSQLKKLKDRDDKWNDITKELNLCSVDHSEGSNSNASQWSCISQYQELHHLVFTESDWGI